MASVLPWRPVPAWLAVTRTRLSFVFGRRTAADSNFGSPLRMKRGYAHYVGNSRILGPGAFPQPPSILENPLGTPSIHGSSDSSSNQSTNNDAFTGNGHYTIEPTRYVNQNPHLPAIDAYILSEFTRLVLPARASDANSKDTRTTIPLPTNSSVTTVTEPNIDCRRRVRARDAYESQEHTNEVDPEPCSLKVNNFSSVVVPSLGRLLAEYDTNAGRILKRVLPGESAPLPGRPLWFGDEQDNSSPPNAIGASEGLGIRRGQDGPVVFVAHVTVNEKERAQKIAVCSGFFISSRRSDSLVGDGSEAENSSPILVSCAHTLEEMRHHKLYTHPGSQSATLVLTRSGQTYFVDSVLSCLPASDIVLYSVSSLPRITPSTSSSERSERPEKRGREIQTLPVNPYPAPENTPTHVHLVAFPDTSVGLTTRSPAAGSNAKSISWLLGIKSSKTVVESEWVKGRVLGYRDRAGREAHPGTYDHLAHILYHPIPSPGSSGSPILDANTGSVIGIVTGAAMANRVEGRRGFGTPAEALFEMFVLPGLH